MPAMPKVHPSAILEGDVKLAPDVEVGAYSIIKGDVTIGAGTRIFEHTHVHGCTTIGENCRLGPAAYIGFDPQHLKYDGTPTWLVIGDGVIVREGASIHRAFKPGIENATKVGSRVFMMGSSHVAHDCTVDDDVVMANGAMLGGHVSIGAKAFVGGGTGIHQFCRVGRLAILSGNEAISRDVPPFAAARYGGLKGYNAVGCKRSGMSASAIHAVRSAYKILLNERVVSRAADEIERELGDVPEVREMVTFIRASKRGIQPSVRLSRDDDD